MKHAEKGHELTILSNFGISYSNSVYYRTYIRMTQQNIEKYMYSMADQHLYLLVLLGYSSNIHFGLISIHISTDNYLKIRDNGWFIIRTLYWTLSEVYLVYTMFRKLALLPSSCDWLSLYGHILSLFIFILVETVGIEPGTFWTLG
jgi:hypothetical protein